MPVDIVGGQYKDWERSGDCPVGRARTYPGPDPAIAWIAEELRRIRELLEELIGKPDAEEAQ